jgi:MFS family permease
MIAGRFFAGLACGMILSVVPVYIAEVSPPKNRGFIVGLQGMMISIGFMAANWIGYAGGFASGNSQWRIPLAMQMPRAILLSIGCFFIPYTPRWLVGKERYDEARAGKSHTPLSDSIWSNEESRISNRVILILNQSSSVFTGIHPKSSSPKNSRRYMTKSSSSVKDETQTPSYPSRTSFLAAISAALLPHVHPNDGSAQRLDSHPELPEHFLRVGGIHRTYFAAYQRHLRLHGSIRTDCLPMLRCGQVA